MLIHVATVVVAANLAVFHLARDGLDLIGHGEIAGAQEILSAMQLNIMLDSVDTEMVGADDRIVIDIDRSHSVLVNVFMDVLISFFSRAERDVESFIISVGCENVIEKHNVRDALSIQRVFR